MKILLACMLSLFPLLSMGAEKSPGPAKAKPNKVIKHIQKKSLTPKVSHKHNKTPVQAITKSQSNEFVSVKLKPHSPYMLTHLKLPAEEQAHREREILRYQSMLWQMWALSNNYWHGTTVPRNLAKGYAWMQIYVNSLPTTYPQMGALLAGMRQRMTEEDLVRAERFYNVYRNKYQLNFQLTEEQLKHAAHLQGITPKPHPVDSTVRQLPNFPQLIQQLNETGKAEIANKLEKAWQESEKTLAENKGFSIVYGRVILAGVHYPQGIASNVPILDEGYFVSAVPSNMDAIYFSHSGYVSDYVSMKRRARNNNLGIIRLNPATKSTQGMIVGSITPFRKLKEVNISLHVVPGGNQAVLAREPWFWHQAPLVVLPNGQFYAEKLSPQRYRLSVSSKGQKIVEYDVVLASGQTKHLPPINVNASVKQPTQTR